MSAIDAYKGIKQLAPIEPGWVFQYLCQYEGEISIQTAPITGQAVVYEVDADRESTGEDELDFVIFEDDRLQLLGEFQKYYLEKSNAYSLGTCPPGFRHTLESVSPQIERFKRQQQKVAR